MVKFRYIFVAAALALALASCGGDGQGTKGPIVLGDSSTIVTETDQAQLKDLVTDLQPVIPPAEDKEQEPAKPAEDSAKEQPVAQATQPAAQKAQPLPTGPGLRAEFGEVTVFVPGLSVKQHGRADLRRASGATYSLTSGTVDGASLRVSGNVTKVSQRYQSIIVLKSSLGDIALDALVQTTSWEAIKGNNNTYPIQMPSGRDVEYDRASAGSIRLAVQREARQRRLSRQKTQHLLQEVRNVRATNQKPLTVVVRSVMWKIDGKDDRGRAYSRQVRLDLPY